MKIAPALVIAVFALLNTGSVSGQKTTSLSFEVATVRISPGGFPTYTGGPGSGRDIERLTIRNYSLKYLLSKAFGLKMFQIFGPSWIETNYDISAKVPSGTTREQALEMLQNLLIERLKLQTHYEKKEFAAYSLVVADKGHKLEPVKLAADAHAGMIFGPQPGNGVRTSGEIDMPGLARILERQFDDALVIDKTGLDGAYKFTLEFAPLGGTMLKSATVTTPEDLSFPSIFTALPEQLGLKLEKGKTMLDVLVIDRGEKTPIEN